MIDRQCHHAQSCRAYAPHSQGVAAPRTEFILLLATVQSYVLHSSSFIMVISYETSSLCCLQAKTQDLLIPVLRTQVGDEYTGATVIEPVRG